MLRIFQPMQYIGTYKSDDDEEFAAIVSNPETLKHNRGKVIHSELPKQSKTITGVAKQDKVIFLHNNCLNFFEDVRKCVYDERLPIQ